jgi:hypothetical protein
MILEGAARPLGVMPDDAGFARRKRREVDLRRRQHLGGAGFRSQKRHVELTPGNVAFGELLRATVLSACADAPGELPGISNLNDRLVVQAKGGVLKACLDDVAPCPREIHLGLLTDVPVRRRQAEPAHSFLGADLIGAELQRPRSRSGVGDTAGVEEQRHQHGQAVGSAQGLDQIEDDVRPLLCQGTIESGEIQRAGQRADLVTGAHEGSLNRFDLLEHVGFRAARSVSRLVVSDGYAQRFISVASMARRSEAESTMARMSSA